MRQNLFDAAFLLGVVSGSSVALALAWLGGLWAFCWTREIWRDVAEEWAMRHGQSEDRT